MVTLYTTLRILGATLRERIEPASGENREAGLTTVEIVVWTAALVILAGIVYAAFQAFVNGKLGQLT